jgi:hypothetical protein
MFSKTLTPVLAIAAALTLAGSAQAIVIDTDYPELNGDDHDFGNSTLVLGSPSGGGKLKFELSGGKLEPRLTGTIHMKDADGTCARMHLEYRDEDNSLLIPAEHGGTVCVGDDKHHEFTVDLSPYADDDIDNVKVQLEKQTAGGWFVVDSAVFSPDVFTDNVKITEDGVDFGSAGWGVGAPNGTGQLSWGLDGVVVEPRLKGAIHLNNSSGVCARINLRYLNASGSSLTARHGGEVCANDNGHDYWTVDLSPYASTKIAKVKVQLQTQGSNGSWNVAGSQTVSIAQ